MKRTISAGAVLSLFLSFAAGATEPAKVLNAKVTRSTGEDAQLSWYWGKPVILVYEDPSSVKLNQPAKDELKRLSELYNLRKVVDVVAVANLEGLDWWPAKPIALSMVRAEETRGQLPVLVDMTGELRKAPWNLNPKSSTMMVVSPKGELLFKNEGKLEGRRLDELKATLERLLTATSSR